MKMMSLQVVFTLVLISAIDLALSSVPLLILGSVKSKVVGKHSGLSITKNDEFQQYLLDKISKTQFLPKVIVFVEDDLSVEDFSWKDKNNLGHYPRLRDVVDTVMFSDFFPSVYLPLEAIQGLNRNGYVLKYFEGTDSLPATDKWNIVWIVRLNNLKNRTKSLRSHDRILVETYNKLSKIYDDVLVLYTGIKSSWELQTKLLSKRINGRRNMSGDEEQTYIATCKKQLIYSTKYPTLNRNNRLTKLFIDEVVASPWGRKKHYDVCGIEHSAVDIVLLFYFKHSPFYWKLDFIKLNKTLTNTHYYLFPLFDISAPIGMSWHSGIEVQFVSNTTENEGPRVTLTFVDFQTQHFLIQGEGTADTFSPAVDVITFFTINIVQALFVVWLLLMILAFGILMLMDIKTHDQFDDMYGKPLTFIVDEK